MKQRRAFFTGVTILLSILALTSCAVKRISSPIVMPLKAAEIFAVEMTWTCDARDDCGRCVRATCNASSLIDISLNRTCIDLASQCMAAGHKWRGTATHGNCTKDSPLGFECPD